MAVSTGYLTYVVDQFAPFANVIARRMFGGIGLYVDGLFFGLIDDDVLYLKVDDSNRPDYLACGAKPFRPFADDPTYSMNYFELPADVLEDSEALQVWSRKSFAAAAAKARTKKKKKSAKKSTTKTRMAKRQKK